MEFHLSSRNPEQLGILQQCDFQTQGSSLLGVPLSDGLIFCGNTGINCTNFTFVQNSIANMQGASMGIANANAGTYVVRNNIWYGNTRGPSFGTGSGGVYTQDHNSCLNSGNCPTGTGNLTDTAAQNPFVNWPSGNFNLAAENSDWVNRLALSDPYAIDVNGTVRSIDRGAYQYQGAVSLIAPTNLAAVAR